jgi:hypothetical protein
MATASPAIPYQHIQILMIRVAQMLEKEEFQQALCLLQKASDEVVQLEAINKQVRMMTNGGRPYRMADEEGIKA